MYIGKEYSYSFNLKRGIVYVITGKDNDILNEIHDNKSTLIDIDRSLKIHNIIPKEYSILPFNIDNVLTEKGLNKIEDIIEEDKEEIEESMSDLDRYYYDNLPR